MYTCPVEPSTLIVVPAGYRCPLMTITPSLTSRSGADTTAGTPHPRATTPAWLAGPPPRVSTPAPPALSGPSSRQVSARTRIKHRPASLDATAAPGQVPH